MKKKSATQSAFLNPRVLIELFIIVAGVSLALLATAKPAGLGLKQAQQKYKITLNPANPIDISVLLPGFDCSQIYELGIDKQQNMRAGLIMIACGLAQGGSASAGACAHNSSNDDRESMWVDNTPVSFFYGRMYISFNNFTLGGGALQVVYSDDGTAWTGPVTLNGSLIRDIQITGDLQGSGRVYVAAMNEGGGGLTRRHNVMYRPTCGGRTRRRST